MDSETGGAMVGVGHTGIWLGPSRRIEVQSDWHPAVLLQQGRLPAESPALHWRHPVSPPDPAGRQERCVECVECVRVCVCVESVCVWSV